MPWDRTEGNAGEWVRLAKGLSQQAAFATIASSPTRNVSDLIEKRGAL
jgi:hypothetical protein